jgi:hypothetical protein
VAGHYLSATAPTWASVVLHCSDGKRLVCAKLTKDLTLCPPSTYPPVAAASPSGPYGAAMVTTYSMLSVFIIFLTSLVTVYSI